MRTLTGGAAFGEIRPVWDGKNDGGVLLPDGNYTWRLNGVARDGDGALELRNGDLGPVTGALTKA